MIAQKSRQVHTFNRPYSILAIAWTAWILYLNSQPLSAFKNYTFKWYHLIPHFDKLVHFAMYGIMTALFWNAVLRLGKRELPAVRRPVLFVLFIPALVGTVDELHQLFVPGRSADAFDLLVDWGAAILVVMMARIANSKRT